VSTSSINNNLKSKLPSKVYVYINTQKRKQRIYITS